MVVSVDVKFVVKSTNEHPYHDIFKHDATYAAKEITEWVEIGIDCYIPHRKFQLKYHSFMSGPFGKGRPAYTLSGPFLAACHSQKNLIFHCASFFPK